MRYLIPLLIIQLSCSSTNELSSGNFNIQTAKSFEFNGLRTQIDVHPRTTLIGRPTYCEIYLLNDQMFRDVATELKLNYSKTFYSYPNDFLDDPIKLADERDTVTVDFPTNNPLEVDSARLERFGITVTFSNLTHSYDTTFLTTVEIPGN